MVTKVSDPKVEEGDVRYLPKELIDDVSGQMRFGFYRIFRTLIWCYQNFNGFTNRYLVDDVNYQHIFRIYSVI